ncbi:MAG: hypothetical protein HXY40_10845 [Chloroflexi bacterium]|nr:hypothetical protein [Chloroflexota bacterium]
MNNNRQIIDEARVYWEADNRPLDLGRVLYDALLPAQRPPWAAGLLRLASTRIDVVPELERVLALAENPARWKDALYELDVLRSMTVKERNPLYNDIIALAQKVAQVTHNASGEPDPFPHDVGWKMIVDLHEIVLRINNPAFSEHVWHVLIEPFHI